MKGIFKDYSGWMQLLVLLSAILIGAISFSIIGYIVVIIQMIATSGIDGEFLNAISNMMKNPVYMRELQFISAVGTFLLPALVCSYMFSDDFKKYLSLDTSSNYRVYLLTILCVVVAMPFLNFTTVLNQQMVLPEWMSGLENWMKKMEETNGGVIEMMMKGKSIWTLLANLLVIAVMAGVGEEFLFRGVGQNIVARWFRNQHVVIWVVAFIFSAIHFQFYGFFPRMLLGAYLGYLLYFTKNMWVPVLAHFTNNAFAVLSYYILQDSTEEMQQIDSVGWGDTWWMAIVSLALFLFFLYRIKTVANYKLRVTSKSAKEESAKDEE